MEDKSISLSALVDLVGGTLVQGDPGQIVTGMNSLADAAPGEVSFLGNTRYASQVGTTQASAILVGADFTAPPPGKAIIAVANPTLAFSAAIDHFGVQRRPRSPGIHPTAFVSPSAKLNPATVHVGPMAVIQDDAELADGCIIHAGASIGIAARLGPNCIIHENAVIAERCILGAGVIIHSCSVIGSDGFGYEFVQGRHVKIDQIGIVELGDDVEVGACSSIDRARFGRTYIGNGTKIDNQVQIGHNVTMGQHCILVSQVGISGSTKLGNHVIMGGQSGASGHLTIGDRVSIMGRGGVIKDLPAAGLYTGFPARPLMEGRRLMAAPALVPALQKRVRALEQRLAELEARLPSGSA
jgi:UDP-3-O-[3-hydroxymyristoyl] glucosamine N-acyltransferase